tara:strand:- start:309 stop:629 length:321 start_codon:yes stop_codon:yes gene_type:complete
LVQEVLVVFHITHLEQVEQIQYLGQSRVQAAVEVVLAVVPLMRQVPLVDQVEAVVSIHQDREVPQVLQPKVLQVVLDILEHKLVAWVVVAAVLEKLEQQEDWLVLV